MKIEIEVTRFEVPSQSLQTQVPVSLLRPRTNRTAALPLLISLDGGIGDRESLIKRQSNYANLFATGVLPPMFVVSFSGGANQFYQGAWADWVITELPAWAAQQLQALVEPQHLLLTGISAGGYGALTIAFQHPHRFRAVAAMEPTILPFTDWPAQHSRANWWMLEGSARATWGEPFPESFLRYHPPNLALTNATQIANSKLEIYLEVGDQDMLLLQDGAEFLHRTLWDLDIAHEYHLVRWADHGGASIESRLHEAHEFLAGALQGGKIEPRDLPLRPSEQAFVDYVSSGAPQRGDAMPPGASQGEAPDRELSVMAQLWASLRTQVLVNDPEMQRRFGRLR